MNHDPNDVKNGELDQTRLTAYALEQLEGAERAAVEALLGSSDRSRHTVEEIRALAAEVKKAADAETLPPRSPDLRAELEQYLGNQEVAEMNAKPEPSSEKAPGQRRRRSTLIWAAAVCALVAAVPGYVIITGSMRQNLRTVALDASAPEAATPEVYDPMSSADEYSYHESEEVRFVADDSGNGATEVRDASIPAEGQSATARFVRRSQLQSPADGPAKARGERTFQAFGRSVDEENSRPAPAAGPAGQNPAGIPMTARIISGKPGGAAGKETSTVGRQAPSGVAADLGIPVSEEDFGAQIPQSGGSAPSLAGSGSSHLALEPNSAPAVSETFSAVKNPRHPAATQASSQPVGEQGAMGSGMGGMDGMSLGVEMQMLMGKEGDEFGVEMGLKDGLLFSGEKAKSLFPPEHRPNIAGRGRAQPTARPAALGQKLAPVELKNANDRTVRILKGDQKDVDEVARIVRNAERLGKIPVLNKSPYVTPARPSNEEYDPIVENEFLSAAENPESTFSVDVDSASYANVRRFLTSGQLPPPSAVRIEELVNYFRYDYPQPDGEVPFSVNMETAQCPWETEHRLVRIGLKGREIDAEQRGPGNLVFLLDVSGSMRDENKLPLVQYAMGMLVEQLTEDDRVAIVTYAGEAGVALESTSGEKRKKIRRAIDGLSSGGSTHGSAGIMMAYDQAMRHFVKGGTNRVILCTDGDLNVGVTSDDELVKLITEQAKSGVFLTVLGFGTGNLKDSKMEKLADRGNGIYAYVDGRREARRVLVEQMAGSLVTIAKDVKLQIEFNPAEVASYRLIGYENRIMAAQDFANDKKDAGEIGAGHTVTALYEIVPGGADEGGELGRELKYQRKTGRELTEAAASGELCTVSLRYKEPDGKKSKLLEFTQKDSDKSFGKASADFRFAASVAAFGMLLRNSQYVGDLNWSAAEEFAAGSLGEDPGGYRNEFLELIHRAGELGSQ